MRGIEFRAGSSISVARGASIAPAVGVGRINAISPGARTLSVGWSSISIGRIEPAGPTFRPQPEARPTLIRTDFFAPRPENNPVIGLEAPKFVPARRVREMPNLWSDAQAINQTLGQPVIERVRSKKRLPRFRSRIDSSYIVGIAEDVRRASLLPVEFVQPRTEEEQKPLILPTPQVEVDIDANKKAKEQARVQQLALAIEMVRNKLAEMSSKAASPASLEKVQTQVLEQISQLEHEQVAAKLAKKQADTQSESKAKEIEVAIVEDEKAMGAREGIVRRIIKRLFSEKKNVSGPQIAAGLPSDRQVKEVKGGVVRNTDQPDHTYQTYTIKEVETAGEFDGEQKAVEAVLNRIRKHRTGKIAKEGNPLTRRETYKIWNGGVEDSLSDLLINRVTARVRAKQRMVIRTVLVEQRAQNVQQEVEPEEIIDETGVHSPQMIELAKQALKMAA